MRDWLKMARRNAGLTLMDLSKLVGVSWQALAYYEGGKRRPTPEVAQKIASVLGFDWTRFYERKDSETA